MSIVSLPQLEGSNLLTHSRRQCRKTCPRKHYYRYELGVRRAETARPLRMGSAVHVGLDLRAQGCSTDEAIVRAVRSYEEAPAWCTTDEQVADWMVEREIVARLLAAYFWYWERPEIPDDLRPVKVIASEGAFDLPIVNPETGAKTTVFRNAGKRDKILQLADGAIVVGEHKTVSEDLGADSDYWKRLELDDQISNYVITARDEGYDVRDVLFDVIRKPSMAPKLVPILDDQGLKIVLDANGQRVLRENILKNGQPGKGHGEPIQSGSTEKGWTLQQRRETPQEFGDRLTADIAERPDWYFARRRIPRLESDLAEFRHGLWQEQQEIQAARKNGRHYRNTAACLLMGRCEYLDVCAGGIDPANPPQGFQRVTNIHPELQEADA